MKLIICFLTYLNRSGSILLAKKLNEYQDISVGIEAEFIGGFNRGNVEIRNQKELSDYLNKSYQIKKFENLKYYFFDSIQNCTLFRVRCLKNLLWDDRIKIGREHIDFF